MSSDSDSDSFTHYWNRYNPGSLAERHQGGMLVAILIVSFITMCVVSAVKKDTFIGASFPGRDSLTDANRDHFIGASYLGPDSDSQYSRNGFRAHRMGGRNQVSTFAHKKSPFINDRSSGPEFNTTGSLETDYWGSELASPGGDYDDGSDAVTTAMNAVSAAAATSSMTANAQQAAATIVNNASVSAPTASGFRAGPFRKFY